MGLFGRKQKEPKEPHRDQDHHINHDIPEPLPQQPPSRGEFPVHRDDIRHASAATSFRATRNMIKQEIMGRPTPSVPPTESQSRRPSDPQAYIADSGDHDQFDGGYQRDRRRRPTLGHPNMQHPTIPEQTEERYVRKHETRRPSLDDRRPPQIPKSRPPRRPSVTSTTSETSSANDRFTPMTPISPMVTSMLTPGVDTLDQDDGESTPSRTTSETQGFNEETYPPELDPIVRFTTTIECQHPSTFGVGVGSTIDGHGPEDIAQPVVLKTELTALDILVGVVLAIYGDALSPEDLTMNRIMERFGLFEAEYIQERDESVSLFERRDSESSELNKPRKLSDLSRIGQHTPRRPSTELLRRRIVRVISWDEYPIYICHNWQFNKKQRRQSAPQKPDASRRFCLVVKELTDEDYELIYELAKMDKTEIDVTVTVPKDNIAVLNETARKLRKLPDDRLQKRIELLYKEENRMIEEIRNRYKAQMNWILETFQSIGVSV